MSMESLRAALVDKRAAAMAEMHRARGVFGDSRVEIVCNGERMLGFSVKTKPNSTEEVIDMLHEIIDALSSPPVKDDRVF